MKCNILNYTKYIKNINHFSYYIGMDIMKSINN